MPKKLVREPTLSDIMLAAAKAHDDLNSSGDWGEVYIIFMDKERNTQAVPYGKGLCHRFGLRVQYFSPSIEDEDDPELALEAANNCVEEVREALRSGWRPVCLHVLPFAEGQTIPLREIEPGSDDQALIWGLTEEVEPEITI